MVSSRIEPISITVNVTSFGHWLAVKRKEHRLSQSDIAKAIGVAYQTVSQWEKEEVTPRLNSDQIDRLCKRLNCAIESVPTQGIKLTILEKK